MTSQKRLRLEEQGAEEERESKIKPCPSFPDDQHPHYVEVGGLLNVRPYTFTYHSYAKGRWLGKSLMHVFGHEFQDHTEAYYRAAIQQGRIRVNDQHVSPDYIYCNSDRMTHTIHRHEPPVLALTAPLIVHLAQGSTQDMSDVLAINKPSSIPVHPTGRYNFNSLLEIMRWKHPEFYAGGGELYPVNRIDRLTSGLVLLCKSKPTAIALQKEFQSHSITKTYLARVKGEFPDGESIECTAPIVNICPRLGVNIVCFERGKACHTKFRKRAGGLEGGHSLVECQPITGRTHQIRVHLQYLGFPIANDVLYGGEEWNNLPGEVTSASEGVKDLRDIGNGIFKGKKRLFSGSEQVSIVLERLAHLFPHSSDPEVGDNLNDEQEKKMPPKQDEEDVFACQDCARPRPDPPLERLSIWLHSWTYAGQGWSYASPLPPWATRDVDQQRSVD